MHGNSGKSSIQQWAQYALFSLVLFAGHALGQKLVAPPELSVIDPQGVNLATGQFKLPGLDVGIGGEGSSLVRQINETSDNQVGILDYVVKVRGSVAAGYNLVASVNGQVYFFVLNSSSIVGTHYSSQWGGSTATLTCSNPNTDFSNTVCTMYLKDGTEAVYENWRLDGSHSPENNNEYFDLTVGHFHLKTLTYPDGEQLSYTYYSNGSEYKALKSVSTSLGWMLKYEVDSAYKVTKVTAINTAKVYCNPDASSCSVGSIYPSVSAIVSGNTTTIKRNGSTLVTTTQSNDTVTVSRPSGVTKTVQYANDRVTSVTVGSATWHYTYSNGTYTVTNPDNSTYSYSQSEQGTTATTTTVTETGKTQVMTYDLRYGRRLVSSNNAGVVTSYTYDNRGNVTQINVTDGGGAPALVTTYTYPVSCSNRKTCNQPTSVTHPDGSEVHYVYNSHGGIETKTHYAVAGIPIETRYTYTQYTPRVKDSAGNLIAQPKVWRLTKTTRCMTAGSNCVSGADEHVSSQSYSGDNVLPYQSTTSLGDASVVQVTTLSHSDLGQVTSANGPKSGSADQAYFFYDSLGRKTGTIGTDPDDSGSRPRIANRVTYSADGQVTQTESGTVTGTNQSALDNMTVLTKTTASYSSSTGLPMVTRSYQGSSLVALAQTNYDSRLRPLCQAQRLNPSVYSSITSTSACSLGPKGPDGNDRITRYSYTDDSRVKSVIEAYGTVVSHSAFSRVYNTDGTLDTVKDADNNLTRYYYDGFHRLIKTCYAKSSDGSQTNSSDCEQIHYDAEGQVDYSTLRDGQVISYHYDLLGRLTGKSGAVSETLVYNNFGQVTSHTRNGVTETYTYNAMGWLLTHQQPMGTVAYDYYPNGTRKSLTYPDGFRVDYGYDSGDNLTDISTSSGGASIDLFYDDRGRRSLLMRGNGRNTSYDYDAQGRLSSLSHSGLSTLSLGYSAAGQLTSKSHSNAAYEYDPILQARQVYVNDDLNRIQSVGGSSVIHDTRGNLSKDPQNNTYSYNANNLMTSATVAGSNVTLGYNASNRLNSLQKAGSNSTKFLYDGVDLIAEYSASGSLLRRYIHGPGQDEPLIWYEGSSTSSPRYLHADQQGSIIATTSNSGSVMNINRYDAYGNKTSSNATYASRFAYTGQVWLQELDLYYYKARMYNAKLGRFMQTDPIGYGDGMNWYAYVGNDPVNGRDPSGLAGEVEEVVVTWQGGGGLTNSDIANAYASYYAMGSRAFFAQKDAEPSLVSGIKVYRKDIDFGGEDKYGHWWIEIDGTESYGWWPKDPVDLEGTLLGVDGELNGQTNFGGTATLDPHHGDRSSGVNVFDVYSTQPRDVVIQSIRSFATSYSGSWSWPTGQNCHSFQNALLDNNGMTIRSAP